MRLEGTPFIWATLSVGNQCKGNRRRKYVLHLLAFTSVTHSSLSSRSQQSSWDTQPCGTEQLLGSWSFHSQLDIVWQQPISHSNKFPYMFRNIFNYIIIYPYIHSISSMTVQTWLKHLPFSVSHSKETHVGRLGEALSWTTHLFFHQRKISIT